MIAQAEKSYMFCNQSKKKKIYEQRIISCEKHHKLNVLVEQQETY